MVRPFVLAGLIAGLVAPLAAECTTQAKPACDPSLEACRASLTKFVAECEAYQMKLKSFENPFIVSGPGVSMRASARKTAQDLLDDAIAAIARGESAHNDRPAAAPDMHDDAAPRKQREDAAPPKDVVEKSKKLEDPGPRKEFVEAYESGDVERAERVLVQEQVRAPKNPAIASLLAHVRLKRGDVRGARAAAAQAIKLDPQDAFAATVLGHADELAAGAARVSGMKIGFEEKQPEFGAPGLAWTPPASPARAAASAPAPEPAARAQARPLLQKAASLIRVGDLTGPGGALTTLSRALMIDPGNAQALVLRAHVSNLPQIRNYEAAISDAREALKLEPASAAALFEKGYAELQLGRLGEALRSVEEGLALAPNSAMGRLYHALILEKAGLAGKAAEEYRLAASLDPSLRPVVDEALSRLAGTRDAEGAKTVSASVGRLPKSLPGLPVLIALLVLSAAALLLEGSNRAFAQEAAAPGDARPDAELPATARGPLQPGTTLGGNFRIERELARGGIGIVYRATDIMLDRPVAIKHLNPQAYESGEVRASFAREAQLAARLRHENLAQIYSVVNDEELYLVFELIDGEDLSTTLTRRLRLPLGEVKAIVADVAAALDYAHSQRIIHRDLKPANVMRAAGGACKVMDFGIAHEARSMTDATQTQAWGTPPYMAPEQELGRVSKESDYYALGVMIYELLSGQKPFEGHAPLERKLRGEFRPIQRVRDDLPDGLHAFFVRAFAPDPAKRFSSAAEMAGALAAVAEVAPADPVKLQ